MPADASRLHGRFAGADRLARHGADPVPGERRREPRPDGLEHAAAGGADPAARRAAVSRPAWSGKVAADSGAAVIARRDGRVDATSRPSRSSWTCATEDGKRRGHLPAAQPAALQQLDLHHAAARSSTRASACAQGQVIADGPCMRAGRAGARPERARRVHAVGRLQLRRRHPALRAAW